MLMLSLKERRTKELVVMPIELQVANECDFEEIPEKAWFDEWFGVVLDEIADERKNLEVSVRICGVDESRFLNLNYRSIDKPTNVLSFPADIESEEFSHVLGDLVICWDLLIAESRGQNKTLMDHASHLLIHGLLHLLGFTHEKDNLATQMEKIEIEILGKRNISNPYEGR